MEPTPRVGPGFDANFDCSRESSTTILKEFERLTSNIIANRSATVTRDTTHTIVTHMMKEGRIGAYYFCSQKPEENSDPEPIIPSLAYQLARKHPEFRLIFVPLVLSKPGIVEGPPHDQMENLIVDPLIKSAISTLIIIDGLGQRKDRETLLAIIHCLGKLVSGNQNARILFRLENSEGTHRGAEEGSENSSEGSSESASEGHSEERFEVE